MDSPGPIYDEVIADSEGEMAEEEDSVRVSQVSTFTLTGRLQATSSISAFTADPPAFWKQDSTTNNMNNQLDQISDIGNFMGTASIADRAKTRQRNTKQSLSAKPNASSNGQLERHKSNANLSSDVIELTDDDELSLRPSRPRSRPKPKLKMKDKTRDMNLDKNTDASGATEITADKSSDPIPDPRPRPRPRPLVKRSKTAHESAVPPLLPLDIPGFPPSSASASHGPELPIAASPVQSHLPTSQLPPSDPPLPTLTTMHDEVDLPRIETLPNLDFDGPLSSPSSLFSDLGGSTKKRKRTMLDLDIDELVSDGGLASGQEGIRAGARYNYDNDEAAHVPSHTLPPPPTFFAGSSSSSTGGGNGRIPSPELGRDVVDLTMLPPTIEPSGAATKKAAKVNKSRQKKSNTIIDEDELDDDFDPTESTKKGKSRPKVKKSTDTKARPNEGRRQVDVSIVSKPRTKKTKGKAKEKATAGNKDTFKSREFIDNSGDEDPIQLIPNAKDPATSTDSHPISTNKSGSHISTSAALRTGDTSSIGTTSIPLSKPLLEGKTLVSPGDKSDSGNTIMSSSSNRMNKKRKSIIESDPEDEDEGEKDPAVGASSKKHKDKRGKYGRKIDDATKDDDDPYMEEHEDIQKEQPPPVPKENVIPQMKSTTKTSKPDSRPNIDNPGLFPSLHSRYEIAPRRSSLPMSELIRRANSIPGSPFATPRTSSSSTARPMKSGASIVTYSPYLKSSRSFLSRIAPLHPNRRTPPPPPPPPPPKKKTKKELEMEEKWEEEMIDSVGGISEWTCLADDEKKELKRAKWAREMGDWDD